MYIDDTPTLTPEILYSKCVALKENHDVALVVVDYLQLMQVPGRPENLAAEFTELSRFLKGMAKELKVAIIALSQLSRYPEYRYNGKPQLSDLQWGSIEAAADIVVLLHRPPQQPGDPIQIEVGVRKQRNGPGGSFTMHLHGEHLRMETISSSADPGTQNTTHGESDELRHSNHGRPKNLAYIAKVIGYSITELNAFLQEAGLLDGHTPMEAAKLFLHPSPTGNAIWSDRLIDYLRGKDPRR